jgi:hypothetical protein
MTLRLLMVTATLLANTGSAFAESHPAWWRYASPEATALVGIQWEHLRSSPFAGAISGELSGDGGLGFPDLECLKQARQTLISSPVLLAMSTGDFPEAMFREQAARKGLKRTIYHDIEIWVTPGKDTLSVAHMSDDLVLLGRVKTLQDAIDRSLLEEANRTYSPLLARAARYAQDDLWVVAARLPDDLAGRFVPIDAEADAFEGAVSLQGGLRLGAILSASTDEAAAMLAEMLKQMVLSLPPVARGIEVGLDHTDVRLTLAVSDAQLLSGLRSTSLKLPEPAKPVPPVKPVGPQIVHIYGLDDGPREIVLR